jgi:type IV pilus assembly protein PilQ
MISAPNHSMGKAAAVLVLIWMATIAAGCASPKKGGPEVPDTGARKIVGIAVGSDADTDRIRILGNQPLTFTAVSKSSPSGVALHFPGTELALGQAAPVAPAVEEAPVAAQVEDLSGPAATRLEAVTVQRLENGIEIRVRADGPVKDYSVFTLNDPDRIVYDIYGVTSPFIREQTIEVGMPWVSRVRHYGDAEKLRVVLDTAAEQFQATTAKPIREGLLIHAGDMAREDADTSRATMAKTDAVAWVNRVDFSAEPTGKSVVTVGTTRPVSYRLEKVHERLLKLYLDDTRIPDYRRRPLNTTRFETAVDRVVPAGGGPGEDKSTVAIELGEPVLSTVEQVDNLVLVHLNEPSTVVRQMGKSVKASPRPEPIAGAPVPRARNFETENDTVADLENRYLKRKSYTGEKIALDFYETDIKNVFRILKEVSGKNFAIDPDVQGAVTLSFDKPVPWDQVMDLVLRMNQLGQVVEGEVIRIATLQTLQREEKLRQERIEAERKTREAERTLEPLMTEYIAINYANVSDVKEKIGDLVTKDRGSIVLDQRNSQIIINDTATKIEKIKKRIENLDRMTPQVLIEARIIEASKNFSRDLGTRFRIGPTSPIHSSLLGGEWDLSLASNFPKGSIIGSSDDSTGISFDFTRLTGSRLSIEAAIDASEAEGETRIISSPRILTLNAEEAIIKQGLTTYQNRFDESGNTVPEEVEINLELSVTPEIKSDNRIDMKIEVKKEDFAGLVAGNISKSTNFASTRLLVNDGETIVIGGITKTSDSNGAEGLPGLRRIPVLGYLFGSKTDSNDKQELLIFITTRIISAETMQ